MLVYAHALGIPADTLRRAEHSLFTLVLNGPRAEVRALRLGAESQESAEVLGGVVPGDTVVMLHATPAKDSMALRGRQVRFVMRSGP